MNEDWFSRFLGPSPTPAGGSLALLTLAEAAALSVKLFRLAGRPQGEMENFAVDFVVFAEEDASFYLQALKGTGADREDLLKAGERHMSKAAKFLEKIRTARKTATPLSAPDYDAVITLGEAALKVLEVNLKANEHLWGKGPE